MTQKLIRLALGVCASLSGVAIAADESAARQPAATAALPVLVAEAETASRWRTHQTDHFTLLYCGEPRPALRHAELLERAHARFHEAFGSAPFRLEAPTDPLVALFFEEKADYLRYARQTDHVDMSWTLAYYSARTNRTAFFRYGRHGTDPAHAGGSDTTSALHEPLDPEAAATFRPLASHLALASATHEAAHQLAFNTGLQQRGVIYPLWASEGLATNFELTAEHAPFGPDSDNTARSDRLRDTYQNAGMLPLHEFVTLTRVPTSDPRATDEVYAQAWGLFRFLYLHRREGLADYLAAMRTAPKGHRDAVDLQDDFTAAFGPIHRLEPHWLAWVDSLDRR